MLLSALILTSAMKTTTIIDQSWEKTLVVGHRGAAAYAPENSLAAFEKGIESGAVTLECDVWMSKDGVPVVIHDKTLDRTTDLTGDVASKNAAEITGAGIPTLDDLIKAVKGRINLVVEIKGGLNVEKAVVDRLKQNDMVETSIVFSFNSEIVSKVKQLNPDQYAVWLSSRPYDPVDAPLLVKQIKTIQADAVGFQFKNVHEKMASALRSNRIPLFVWTVPPGEEVDRLEKLKVNFIISDHPKDVVEQIENL